MANSSTLWLPLSRYSGEKRAWLLDDGSIMEEPALQRSGSGRRVRLAAVHSCADYAKNLDPFLVTAAQTAARLKGRKLWIALGKGSAVDGVDEGEGGIKSTLDESKSSRVKLSSLHGKLRPHFLEGTGRYRNDNGTKAAWRFRHETMPIEAQIEVTVSKETYGSWEVTTRIAYPGTWPHNAHAPVYFSVDSGNEWGELAKGASIYGDLSTRLSEWKHANPIDWCDGFEFGTQKFDEERHAINAFAKIVRAVMAIEDIEIPNLLNVDTDGSDVDKIEMLSLRFYRTNASQELLDILSDYLTGEPVVDQIKEKWSELSELFRRLGMVIVDPADTDWWNFVTMGANAKPVEAMLRPVEDDDSTDSTQHKVMINLATGTIVVACSKSATRDETAVQWETSLIKAEMTGNKDRFLAYADKYVEERQDTRVQEMMDAALERTKTK